MSAADTTHDFAGRTVMITGAAGNLGRAVARAFAAHGARLLLVDRDLDALQASYGPANELQSLAQADLLDRAAVDALAHDRRIDVLCNLAGGFAMGPRVHELADADLDRLFDVNVRTMLNAVRAVVPAMLQAGAGAIVNVGATAALRGAAGMGAYCASKDAVIRLTEAMAAELRDDGIRVNCVLPSIIDTPENRAAMPDADFSRWVAPEALADVIVFLASRGARAVHGAAVPVAGRV